MASYRLLAPHYINNALLPAGSVVSTGVELPDAWVPAPNCEPLDADSLAQFYVQGASVAFNDNDGSATSNGLGPDREWVLCADRLGFGASASVGVEDLMVLGRR